VPDVAEEAGSATAADRTPFVEGVRVADAEAAGVLGQRVLARG
jgi:hypothetical protein